MLVVFENVLVLAIFALVGFIMCKFKVADSTHSKLLSSILIYLVLPSKIFITLAENFTIDYLSKKYIFVIAGTVILIILMAVAYPVAKFMGKHSYEQNVYWYSIITPNYGYIGYPLAENLFGAQGLLNLIVFSLATSIYAHTIGFCVLSKTEVSFKSLLKQPPIIGTLIGAVIGLSGIHIPSVLNSVITGAGNCMAPISMILFGMVLSEYKFSDMFHNVLSYPMALLRLIVIPAIIGGTLSLFAPSELVITAVLMYATPYGFNPIVCGRLVGEDCRLGAGLACISAVLSCVTIPIMVSIFS